MEKKIAVITGANRGLGLATAKKLAADGYHVIVTARNAESAVSAENGVGNGAQGHTLDVSDDDSVDRFFTWLESEHGRIDVLVNNAGAMFQKDRSTHPFDIEESEIKAAFNTNALGAWRMMRRAIPLMNQNGYGRIVNVSSGLGQLSEMGGGLVAYRVSKTAMNAMTRIAAAEAQENVKVNTICPGWVRTDMGGESATRSVEEGIFGIVWAATLDEDGPSNGFFRDGEAIDW